MLFGIPSLPVIVVGGVALLLILGFQVFSGTRIARHRAPSLRKVHRLTGITLLALATFHATFALLYFFGVPVG